jgi:hypothetical protein
MIKEVNNACTKFGKVLGVSVKLPTPTKETLKTTSTMGFIVGAGLLTASVVLSSKSCAILGGISIISGVIQKHEAR